MALSHPMHDTLPTPAMPSLSLLGDRASPTLVAMTLPVLVTLSLYVAVVRFKCSDICCTSCMWMLAIDVAYVSQTCCKYLIWMLHFH